MHCGVFAVGPDVAIPLADETAALLAVRAGAALSHHTAAILWRLRGPDSGDGLIHVTVPGASVDDRAGVRVHRSTVLRAHDVRVQPRAAHHFARPGAPRPRADHSRRAKPNAPLDQMLIQRLGTLGQIN